jgi:hypothetical protein
LTDLDGTADLGPGTAGNPRTPPRGPEHPERISGSCPEEAAAAVPGGQGVTTARLLDRALRDAQQHVPLTDAISAVRVAQ